MCRGVDTWTKKIHVLLEMKTQAYGIDQAISVTILSWICWVILKYNIAFIKSKGRKKVK